MNMQATDVANSEHRFKKKEKAFCFVSLDWCLMPLVFKGKSNHDYINKRRPPIRKNEGIEISMSFLLPTFF